MAPNRNHLQTIAIVALSVIAATITVAYIMQVPILAFYHRLRHDAVTFEQTRLRRDDPRPGFVYIQAVQDLETPAFYHRQRLLELDAIAKIDYTFANIKNTDLSRSVLKEQLASGSSPENLMWESPETKDPSPMKITVWCDHSEVATWETFLKAKDQGALNTP